MKKFLAVLLCVSVVLGAVQPALAQSGPTGSDGDTPVHRVFLPNVSSASTSFATQFSPDEGFLKAIALLRPYVLIASNGIPSLRINRDAALALGVTPLAFDAIQSSMQEVAIAIDRLPQNQQPVVRYENGQWQFFIPADEISTVSVCVTIPKWALQAYAWYVIAAGGAFGVVGLFLDATILGLPAGAVLQALGIGYGITGSALLWWVDNYYPAQGRQICIW